MGIILSSFMGCGREFLKNTHGDKIKIFDAVETGLSEQDEEFFDLVMGQVDSNDIVFIPSSEGIRNLFNENNVDYDVFYPSKERRGEFIENQVRKRSNPKNIQNLDKNFDKWVQEIDDDESPNCYKHKLSNMGEFIGNSPIIMQYIDSLKNQPKTQGNTQTNNEEKIEDKND